MIRPPHAFPVRMHLGLRSSPFNGLTFAVLPRLRRRQHPTLLHLQAEAWLHAPVFTWRLRQQVPRAVCLVPRGLYVGAPEGPHLQGLRPGMRGLPGRYVALEGDGTGSLASNPGIAYTVAWRGRD
jgi:hypothetical protein